MRIPDGLPTTALGELDSGSYERPMLNVARQILKPDDVVIEAGGGFGHAAIAMSAMCRDVWTVEADPVYYAVLADNAHERPNVHALHGALVVDGFGSYCDFHRHGDFRGSSVLPLPGQPIQVPAIDVSQLIRWTRATVLVLDIEGYEYEMLGDQRRLREVRALVVEWHPASAPLEPDLVYREIELAGMDLMVEDMELPQTPARGYARA